MWFMRKLLHGRTEKLLTQSFQKQMKTVYVLDKCRKARFVGDVIWRDKLENLVTMDKHDRRGKREGKVIHTWMVLQHGIKETGIRTSSETIVIVLYRERLSPALIGMRDDDDDVSI